MNKFFYIVLLLVLCIGVDQSSAQKIDMRTKAGKAAMQRQKKANVAVGALNMATELSDKENRKKAKAAAKNESKKLKESMSKDFNKLKETWKNRKK